jgi:toxin ParE1/3/4
MDHEIVWTEPATAQLQDAITYVAERNPPAAERIASEILQRVELLKSSPLMGSVYPANPPGRYRKLAVSGYRIFYRVKPEANRVEILAVWHGSRQEPELPE